MYIDAMNQAVEVSILKVIDGVKGMMQYISKQLDDREKKFAVIGKEWRAVVYCLRKLRLYLQVEYWKGKKNIPPEMLYMS